MKLIVLLFREMLSRLNQMEHRIMSKLDDVVAQLSTDIQAASDADAAEDAAIVNEISALATALSTGGTSTDAAAAKLAAIATTLESNTADSVARTAALVASLPVTVAPVVPVTT